MKIQVVGASGHLGRKVMLALLEQGAGPGDLIAGVRTPEKAANLERRGVIVRRADYDDPASLTAAFQDTDVLLLIPTLAPVEPRILQHGRALAAAGEAGVKRILFSSFVTAVPHSRFLVSPFMLYAESKLRVSGLDWTILRNGMYLDPIADWIPELVEMGHLPYPVRQGRVAYISRDDLARATASACLESGHSGKVYELTGSGALSMPDLAGMLSRVTGKTIRFDGVTEAEYAEVCRKGREQVPEMMIPVLTSLYRAVDNHEFAAVTHDVELLTGAPAEHAENYLLRMV